MPVDAPALAKFQACHQCRKRKLKCNAHRPACDNCVRSHRRLLAKSDDRAKLPAFPACTYDEQAMEPPPLAVELADGGDDAFDMTSLNISIAKLEATLERQDAEIERLLSASSAISPSPAVAQQVGSPESHVSTDFQAGENSLLTVPHHHDRAAESWSVINGTRHLVFVLPESDNSIIGQDSARPVRKSSISATPSLDLYELAWPSRLPHPELLHHLSDIFFKTYPYATRILHRASYETALSLSPSSPSFPKSSLIHAICAVASLHSTYVDPPERRFFGRHLAGDLHYDTSVRGWKLCFGEIQADYASEVLFSDLQNMNGSYDAFQAAILLTYFHNANGTWLPYYYLEGLSLQIAHLWNLHCTDDVGVPGPSLWPHLDFITIPALMNTGDDVQRETLRNCFWVAYAAERCNNVAFGFPQVMSDISISQVLPTTSAEIGRSDITPSFLRQSIDSADVLTVHPLMQTDSFVLYVKASILVSKVKEFNLRYPIREEDPDRVLTSDEFQGLHTLIMTFVSEIPRQYRDILYFGTLDLHSLMCLSLPWAAMLALHTPHSDPFIELKYSSVWALKAARRILELLCQACNASFDLTLIDPSLCAIWQLAALEIGRAAMARAKVGRIDEAMVMRSEVEIFIGAFSATGERIPVAYRRRQMLIDGLSKELDPLLGLGERLA